MTLLPKEILINNWPVSLLCNGEKCYGILFVTNRRVLFNGNITALILNNQISLSIINENGIIELEKTEINYTLQQQEYLKNNTLSIYCTDGESITFEAEISVLDCIENAINSKN